jgi:hypothetical protein
VLTEHGSDVFCGLVHAHGASLFCNAGMHRPWPLSVLSLRTASLIYQDQTGMTGTDRDDINPRTLTHSWS